MPTPSHPSRVTSLYRLAVGRLRLALTVGLLEKQVADIEPGVGVAGAGRLAIGRVRLALAARLIGEQVADVTSLESLGAPLPSRRPSFAPA